MNKQRPVVTGPVVISAVAILFFVVCTGGSYMRWTNFAYRTFDLAYYVQAIWQLIHGRFEVSVEHVPLLGNHVEPIVFLFAPLFALFRHPLLFVAVQNAALATMGPVGFAIARRLGFDQWRACLLGAALLVTPAAGYIALHEFHPEALTASFLLLLLHARVAKSLWKHWLWFLAVLACKENMALLLAAYCVTLCLLERTRPREELLRWYIYPLGVAVGWFLLCALVITPALNSGNIDYVGLYDRLGSSPGEILLHLFTQPWRFGLALWTALRHGNLWWALLLPFLGLPLLRPRWLVIAAPILLQHFLSWRSSEWNIYFHYAAPLLPLFWFAAVEGIALSALWGRDAAQRAVPALLLIACALTQAWLGPAPAIAAEAADWSTGRVKRERKNWLADQIPPAASVVAPLPYLSHLAMREKLFSMHYILKGLKTLSRARYEPPLPTDYVLIDYDDAATFDASAGYYHPRMQTKEGALPSSDRLLHEFLKCDSWVSDSRNELVLLRRATTPGSVPRSESVGGASSREPESIPGVAGAPPSSAEGILEIGTHSHLLRIDKSAEGTSKDRPLQIRLQWKFQGEREIFPWMLIRAQKEGVPAKVFTKGLCAPEIKEGDAMEEWNSDLEHDLPAGDYAIEAIFIDNSRRAWYEATGGGGAEAALLCPPVPLGRLQVKPHTEP